MRSIQVGFLGKNEKAVYKNVRLKILTPLTFQIFSNEVRIALKIVKRYTSTKKYKV